MTGYSQLDQLSALRDSLQTRKTKLVQKTQEVDEQLKAVTLTLSLMNRGEEPPDAESVIVPPKELQGLTQIEALVYIAQHNANRVKITDAKRLLAKAGVMKVTKNSYGILYTVINRSGKFKRCSPGEYELIVTPAGLVRTA